MRGSLRFLAVTAIVVFIASAGLATPSVSFIGFNGTTFEYTYQVTLGTTDTLDQFTINTLLPTSYSADISQMADPDNIVGNGGFWDKGLTSWQSSTYRSYRWRNGEGTGGWVGQFKLTVLDSHPATGGEVATTSEGFPPTVNKFTPMQVPELNPAPEPSALAGMGAMLLAMAPVLRRLRKQ